MKSIKSQGLSIPHIGFGTFRMPGDSSQAVVESAFEVGYRHIDTASMYENEAAVGRAIKASGLKRDKLFLTTKVWHDQLEPTALLKAFEISQEKLDVDYVDLYMVHWPSPSMDLTRIMEGLMSLREAGKIRGIGVCNFNMTMLRHVIDEIKAPVAAVQAEYHPFLNQDRQLAYLQARNIPLVAYAPLAQGRVASDLQLESIALKHRCTAAQVAIAWLIEQKGVIAIPKAQHSENQRANIEAENIQLDDEDRKVIARFDKTQRYVRPTFAPDWDS